MLGFIKISVVIMMGFGLAFIDWELFFSHLLPNWQKI